MKILCPEEIAFKKGYISSDDLYTIAEEYSNSEYGKYLKKLITWEHNKSMTIQYSDLRKNTLKFHIFFK